MKYLQSPVRFLSAGLLHLMLVVICPAAWAIDVLYQGPDSGSWNVTANWANFAPPDVAFNESAVINNFATVVLSEHTKSSFDGIPPFVDVNIGGLRIGSAASTTGGLRIVSGGILEAVAHPGGTIPPETGAITIGSGGQGNLTILGNGLLTATSLSLGGTVGSSITVSDTATVNISGIAILGRTTTISGPSVTFSAAGDLSLSSSSILIPDIRSATSHSPLVTEGTANVNGTLKPMFTGVMPMLGNKWTLIDAAMAINGTFGLDLSMAPALPTGQGYEIIQATNGTRKLLQLSVEEVALPGDYNHDGTVDAADYVVWRKTDGSPEGYNTWRANFGRTMAGGSVTNATVPEPATALLLILAVAFGCGRTTAICLARSKTRWP